MLLSVFHMERDHKSLLNEVYLARFVEVEGLSDAFLDQLLVLNVIQRLIYFLLLLSFSFISGSL